jgi:outer membrane lipoprotein LolB
MSGRPLALIALLALAACHPAHVRPVAPPSVEERAALATLSDWHATGRVAVRAASEGFSASFDWRENAGHGELGVRGPFGSGAARISRSSERIRIESGTGAPIDLTAPFETLEPALTARLGFPLPLEPLRFWVLGVPAPSLPSDGEGPTFRQAGWEVSCGAFTPVGGAPGPLPTRLLLTRATTRIRVVIDRWQVGAG